jgi:GT2 family glycosyltransferase
MTSLRTRPQPTATAPAADVPARVVELELTSPIKPVPLREDGSAYACALCLVRVHGWPLGLVWLRPEDAEPEVPADAVARQIWAALADRIRSHLAEDGEAEPDPLGAGGLSASATGTCAAAGDAARTRACPASVVVATRQRPAALARCLESLLALDHPCYEVIVVDNAPGTPTTRDLVTGARFGNRVTYVCEPRPGLAAAHNRGLDAASGALIAFTDDDVTVDRRWLLELAAGFERTERVGCVTGLIVPAELNTPAQLLAERLWGFNKGFAELIFDHDTDRGDALYPYTAGSFGSGANMAFDTAVLRRLGGFDPATGAGTPARGGDDLAAFFTVVSAGYRLVYRPAAFVRHAHHAEYAALERQAFGYGVGLTAFLTKAVVDRPGRLLELARLSRHGVARALDPRGGRDATIAGAARVDRPAGLIRAERRGMLHGPAAYVRSRHRTRVDAQP